MTHEKIARIAKVSPSTVSKALSGSKEINPETIYAIRKIAEDSGYFNERKERRKRSSIIESPTMAVLCPEIISPYYASIITHLQGRISRFGGKTATYICGFNEKYVNEQIKSLSKDEHIDALVCFSSDAYRGKLPIPLLYMQQIDKSAGYDAVFNSASDTMEKAIQHLKSLGHTQIGFIGETNTIEKLGAFKKVMEEQGLAAQDKYIHVVNKRFEQIGYEAVKLMLASGNIPTAFITAYDEIALGAIRDLKSAGYSVPSDISFIGINDVPFLSYMDIPLTTIGSHMEEQCSIAADLLERKIKDPNFKAVQHITVQSELIIRQTTAEKRIK
ncbi:MAG: LacI family DNA-binding transcriptional regulator [Eubacteriales bacterium]